MSCQAWWSAASDESWTMTEKCCPSSSSARQPTTCSTASLMNVKRPLLVDRPGHVRRVPQDVAIALLGLAQLRVEAGVGHGDGGVVGKALEDAPARRRWFRAASRG